MQEAIQNKSNKLADKLNELNKKFEQIDDVCSTEIVDFIEQKQQDIEVLTDSGNKDIIVDGEVLVSRSEVIKLQIMVDDYKEVRQTLLDTTRNGKKILEQLTLELMDADEEGRPAAVMAYSSLVGTINQSVKILASSYKDISAVLLNLDKLDKGKDPKITVNGDINVQNNQNNHISSATDLIKQLKRK